MGYGPISPSGKQLPITPRNGKNWMDTVNDPIPQHVKNHHADQFAATSTHSVRLPGSVQWPIAAPLKKGS